MTGNWRISTPRRYLLNHDHIGKHRWETYIVVRASGECYLPPGSTPTPSPTPTPGPAFPEDPYEALEALGDPGDKALGQIPDIISGEPTPTSTPPADVPDDSGTPDSGSSLLVNGMLVEVSVTQWYKDKGVRRTWLEKVNVLRYTLHFSVKPGPAPPPPPRWAEDRIPDLRRRLRLSILRQRW